MGHDAVLLRASLHASPRKARKNRWASTVFRYRSTHWHAETSREFCVQVLSAISGPENLFSAIVPGVFHLVFSYCLMSSIDRLELNGHHRRLSWEATPRSIHEGVQSAIMQVEPCVPSRLVISLKEALSVRRSIHDFVYPRFCPPVCPSVRPSVHPSIGISEKRPLFARWAFFSRLNAG